MPQLSLFFSTHFNSLSDNAHESQFICDRFSSVYIYWPSRTSQYIWGPWRFFFPVSVLCIFTGFQKYWPSRIYYTHTQRERERERERDRHRHRNTHTHFFLEKVFLVYGFFQNVFLGKKTWQRQRGHELASRGSQHDRKGAFVRDDIKFGGACFPAKIEVQVDCAPARGGQRGHCEIKIWKKIWKVSVRRTLTV